MSLRAERIVPMTSWTRYAMAAQHRCGYGVPFISEHPDTRWPSILLADHQKEELQAWLAKNVTRNHCVTGRVAAFEFEDDALLCYMTFAGQ